jgi:hypothetical protein
MNNDEIYNSFDKMSIDELLKAKIEIESKIADNQYRNWSPKGTDEFLKRTNQIYYIDMLIEKIKK